MADELSFLVNWYASHCDGDWEHGNGIRLTTLDNPGWAFKVHLEDTELAGRPFDWISIDRSDFDWVHYRCADDVFEAACGARNLPEALGLFRTFVEAPSGASSE